MKRSDLDRIFRDLTWIKREIAGGDEKRDNKRRIDVLADSGIPWIDFLESIQESVKACAFALSDDPEDIEDAEIWEQQHAAFAAALKMAIIELKKAMRAEEAHWKKLVRKIQREKEQTEK